MLNSAVTKGDFLITGDLSFYDADNIDEAYYLSAILNSNILTEQIKIMKSSRHIFKLPFEISIKKFDPKNKNHKKLTGLAKKGEKIVREEIIYEFNKNKEGISKPKIQKVINKTLEHIFKEIDECLIDELK